MEITNSQPAALTAQATAAQDNANDVLSSDFETFLKMLTRVTTFAKNHFLETGKHFMVSGKWFLVRPSLSPQSQPCVQISGKLQTFRR